MQIQILTPGDEGRLERFLMGNLDSSLFLINNMRSAGLVDHGQRLEGTYAARFGGGEITGVVAHYWNMALVYQVPGAANEELQALQNMAVLTSRRPIQRLLGPVKQVEAASVALEISDGQIQMDEKEDLFALNLDQLVVPEILRSGQASARLIQKDDLALVTGWRVGYHLEVMGERDTPRLWDRSQAEVARRIELGSESGVWLLEVDNRPVAMTGFNATIREAVQVGGVYTPPELRSRGYARAAVGASLLAARRGGARQGVLFTGQANVPAQRAYRALGFKRVGDYRIMLLREPMKVS